jgi:transcriptional regulator with XRE-family HTH domain
VYNHIFFTNVLRLMDMRGLTKAELSEHANISTSFLSDLTNGKANPSLKIMEAIAAALETPLPLLLESTDLDRDTLKALANDAPMRTLPDGYKVVSAILPEYRAFIVRKWEEEARGKLATIGFADDRSSKETKTLRQSEGR